MRCLWLGILLAAVESLAFGQLDSDTLTVSVSQSFALQPDQVLLSVSLPTPASTGLDELVASLKGSGITAANLSNVSLLREHTLIWLFTIAVPLSKIPSTAAQLNAQKIPFYVQGSQVSAESQQAQQCPLPSLMADAKAQAKKLADSAELVVGDILALSGGSPSILNSGIAVPAALLRGNIDPTSGAPFPAVIPAVAIPPVVRANCSLVVKFKLLRYHY
jgi:hypothetical protein